jgi:hypothetical protein
MGRNLRRAGHVERGRAEAAGTELGGSHRNPYPANGCAGRHPRGRRRRCGGRRRVGACGASPRRGSGGAAIEDGGQSCRGAGRAHGGRRSGRRRAERRLWDRAAKAKGDSGGRDWRGAPMPSGEVMPSAEGVGAPPTVPTWAMAKAGESATANIAGMINRAISTAPMPPPRRK